MRDLDVLVAGGGPAGRALAAACAAQGLRAAALDPHPARAWPNHYGIWLDEAAGLTQCLAHRWAGAAVALGGPPRLLDRAYASVANDRLRDHFDAQAPCWAGEVTHLDAQPTHTEVGVADGQVLRATVVVDATGRGLLLGNKSSSSIGFQSAFGRMVRAPNHGLPLDRVGLMDFSAVPGAPASPPTFLYLLPFGPDRLFVEETVLAGRPATDFDVLAARLDARLAYLGLTVEAVESEERCLIPLGGPLPPRAPRVLAFGAAAGMIHPATGYSLGHTLRAAPQVAAALATALAVPNASPESAVAAGWAALWPREKWRLWGLYRFGLEVLLGLDLPETQAFFSAFFDLPAPLQAGWLAGTLTMKEATRAMRGVFAGLPAGLRLTLIGHGMRPHGWRLLGTLLG